MVATTTSEIQAEAKYPQDEGVLESLTMPPDLAPRQPLFDEPTFNAEVAWHEVMRKSETVESARSNYELAKADAADAKKALDTRQKELEDLIKELRWKEQRADRAKLEPKLVETADGVEGMGAVSTEDVDALGNPWPEDLGSREGDEDGVGASTDAGGDDETAAG